MVAVLIISVVILALMQMYGNYSHIFSTLKQKTKVTAYGSFFLSNRDFGFERKSISLDELVSDFKVEDELRRELKDKKIELIYQELEQIDMSKFDASNDEEDEPEEKPEVNADMIFEIGKSILKVDESSVAMLRLQIK